MSLRSGSHRPGTPGLNRSCRSIRASSTVTPGYSDTSTAAVASMLDEATVNEQPIAEGVGILARVIGERWHAPGPVGINPRPRGGGRPQRGG